MKLAALTASPAMKSSLVALGLIVVWSTVARIWKATEPVSGLLMPLHAMRHLQLRSEHPMQTEEWAEDGGVPVRLNLQRRGVERTVEDSLPFPGKTVGHEFYTIRGCGMVNGGRVRQEIVARAAGALHRFRTPTGALGAAIWRDPPGLDVQEIARGWVVREVRRRIGPADGVSARSLNEAGSHPIGYGR